MNARVALNFAAPAFLSKGEKPRTIDGGRLARNSTVIGRGPTFCKRESFVVVERETAVSFIFTLNPALAKESVARRFARGETVELERPSFFELIARPVLHVWQIAVILA